MNTPLRVALRLMSAFDIDEAGCWISRYSTGSHGYSQIGWQAGGKTITRLGHRVAYEFHNGPIPDGLTVDHICRQRRCINPDHLQLLTNEENGRRNGNWAKTHCVRGHAFTDENTRWNDRGHRWCRACQKMSNNARYVS